MIFHDELIAMAACSEAVKWVGLRTRAQAWAECERPDWMLWLVGMIDKGYSPRLRLAACACARIALRYVPEGEDRPRLAIECAERYARDEATDSELAAGWDAAGEAARAAAWVATWAAGWVATRAAGWAATAAARAATWVAARATARKEMADIVRSMIPDPYNEVKP